MQDFIARKVGFVEIKFTDSSIDKAEVIITAGAGTLRIKKFGFGVELTQKQAKILSDILSNFADSGTLNAYVERYESEDYE